jgi:hypothetical protein
LRGLRVRDEHQGVGDGVDGVDAITLRYSQYRTEGEGEYEGGREEGGEVYNDEAKGSRLQRKT